MRIIAVDPGTFESGFVVWDGKTVMDKGKIKNQMLLDKLKRSNFKVLVIEQIRSYGNAMGQSTIDTVFWSGRFAEAFVGEFYLMPRVEVKKHICHTGAAKDSNIIQALVDRFAYGQKNYGKGTKAKPGFFYGFKADIWQAFALGVCFWDQNIG